MKYDISPRGVCATKLEFELEKGILKNVRFHGGCNGNLKAIATLVEGLPAEQVKDKLLGIKCGMKATSCTDQLAKALKAAMEEE